MARGKRRNGETSPTFGPKKFGDAVRQHLKEHRLLLKANNRQDFPWFVECLENWLRGKLVRENLEGISVRAQNTLRKMARESLQTLYDLWRQDGYITKPHCMGLVAEALIPSSEAREHFTSAVREQCLVYLHQTLSSDPVNIPPVTRPDERHSPNRKRSELPDPEQPAWASVNRHKSKKVQITCRIERHVKGRIEAAAYRLGQSQAAWIEAAIKNALLDHGYVLPHKPRRDQRKQKQISVRRRPRLVVPELNLSRHASVNRTDKSTSVRMCKRFARLIDDERQSHESRSQWLSEAVQMFLEAGNEMPKERPVPSGPLTEVVGLRFDRKFFAELGSIIAKSGLSKSDWFRSVALWRIKTH